MAGTMVLTSTTYLDGAGSIAHSSAIELLVTFTADAALATVPTLAITDYKGFWITKVVTNPGATAPTADYDITGIDADGADIFNGELLNRSAASTETVIPLDFIQIGNGGFTLTIANNLVNSAVGTIRLFLNK
jgi:hypothetical protein